jgi:excisionase family DNA binding protein
MSAPHDAVTRLIGPDGSVTVPPELVEPLLQIATRHLLDIRKTNAGGALSKPMLRMLSAMQEAATISAELKHPDRADETMVPETRRLETEEEITATQAAKLLGISVQYVTRACASGRIVGRKVGSKWLVQRRSIEQYPTGRPKHDG